MLPSRRVFEAKEEDFYHLDFEHKKYGTHIEVDTQYPPDYQY